MENYAIMTSNKEITVTYDLESLTHYRPDGTYEGIVNGLPYHVIPSDVLWEKAVAMAAAMGDDLPPQPPYVPPSPLQLSARQLRLGLIRSNVTSTAVVSCINAITNTQQREEMMVEWEYATSYAKTNAFVQLLKTKLFATESAFEQFWSSSALI